MTSKPKVQVRRAYEEAAPQDGTRVLVDRIWPRGLTKDKAQLDEWCKQIAPSTALRKWYGHDPARFEEFARRYRAELEEPERAEALYERFLLRARDHVGAVASGRFGARMALALVNDGPVTLLLDSAA